MANIVIDGYNLIRQSPSLSQIEANNFEMGRTSLVRKLSEYKKLKGHQITVVFDAADTDNLTLEEYRQAGIRIIFSEMHQKADEVIIRMARNLGGGVIVVSSDREILTAAQRAGCGVMTSGEFERVLNNVGANLVFAPGQSQGSPLHGNMFKPEDDEETRPINKRWITQKKGPSHRLPKAKRRAYAKLRGI